MQLKCLVERDWTGSEGKVSCSNLFLLILICRFGMFFSLGLLLDRWSSKASHQCILTSTRTGALGMFRLVLPAWTVYINLLLLNEIHETVDTVTVVTFSWMFDRILRSTFLSLVYLPALSCRSLSVDVPSFFLNSSSLLFPNLFPSLSRLSPVSRTQSGFGSPYGAVCCFSVFWSSFSSSSRVTTSGSSCFH